MSQILNFEFEGISVDLVNKLVYVSGFITDGQLDSSTILVSSTHCFLFYLTSGEGTQEGKNLFGSSGVETCKSSTMDNSNQLW